MIFLPVTEPWWAKYAAQLIIAGFSAQFLTNVRSILEHWLNRKKEREHTTLVVKKLDAIHDKVNGGLREVIREEIQAARQEKG